MCTLARVLSVGDIMLTLGNFMDLASVHVLATASKTIRNYVVSTFKWFGVPRTAWSVDMVPSFLISVTFDTLRAAHDADAGALNTLHRCSNVMVQFDTMAQLSSRSDVVRAIVDGARGGHTVIVRFWSTTEESREVHETVFNVVLGHVLKETTSSVPMYVVVHGMMLARTRTLVDEDVVLEDMSARFLRHLSDTSDLAPEYLPTIRNTPMAHRADMLLNRMLLDALREQRAIHMDKLFTMLRDIMHYIRLSKSSKSTVSIETGWFVAGLFRTLATMLRFYQIEYMKGTEFRLYNMARCNYRDAVIPIQKMVAKLNVATYNDRLMVCVDDAKLAALRAEWRSTSAAVYMAAQYVPVRGRATTAEQQSKRRDVLAELQVLSQQLQIRSRKVDRGLVRARQIPLRNIDIGLLDSLVRLQASMCTDPYRSMNVLYRHTVPSLLRSMAAASPGPARGVMLLRVIQGIIISATFSYSSAGDVPLRYTHRGLMTSALAMVTRCVDTATLAADSAYYMTTAVRSYSCVHLLDASDIHNVMLHAMTMFFRMPVFIIRHHGMELLHAMMQTMKLSEAAARSLQSVSKRMRLNCGAQQFDPIAAFYNISPPST
jgi:hypothetical protein